jgi:hypothetical protein
VETRNKTDTETFLVTFFSASFERMDFSVIFFLREQTFFVFIQKLEQAVQSFFHSDNFFRCHLSNEIFVEKVLEHRQKSEKVNSSENITRRRRSVVQDCVEPSPLFGVKQLCVQQP